ncbi:MAG: tetratricopeptide repeat protein, partial [Pyrinomonadaceae bacterium]
MNKKNLLIAMAGAVIGLVAGFILTNSLNQHEVDNLRTELKARSSGLPNQPPNANTGSGGANASQPGSGSPLPTLSDAELRNVLARADNSPNDADLQLEIGRTLYLYAIQARNPAILPDAARLLKRTSDARPKDFDTLVLLGNAYFDIGQTSDATKFTEARSYYQKALSIRPDDVDVRTDLGLSYYAGKPSDPVRALAEYRRSLAINSKHVQTLQNMIVALIETGNMQEARQRFDELQAVDPSNPQLEGMRARLSAVG